LLDSLLQETKMESNFAMEDSIRLQFLRNQGENVTANLSNLTEGVFAPIPTLRISDWFQQSLRSYQTQHSRDALAALQEKTKVPGGGGF